MLATRAILALFGLASIQICSAIAPFYDCDKSLGNVRSEQEALDLVKQVHADKKFRFSSECLDILLRRNLLQASEYLMEEVYPKSVDTEIIVKQVTSEVQKKQNELLYIVMKKQAEVNGKEFPKAQLKPVLYEAQSPEHVHILARLQTANHEPDCPHSFNRRVEMITNTQMLVEAACYDAFDPSKGVKESQKSDKESNFQLYSQIVQLYRGVKPETLKVNWDGDGKIEIRLDKGNGASYWQQMTQGTETKHMWRKVHVKYLEMVQDYKRDEL